MTTRDGQLSNAPLIYVLASLRFAPWPLLKRKIDEIHDDLREYFPLINRIEIQQVGPNGQPITQNDGPSAWILKTSDLTYSVQFAPDQVLIACKKYARYRAFESNVVLVMNTLLKHMRFIDVTNVGVRYIDHIKAREGETLKQYINKSLLPPDIDGLAKIGGSLAAFYKSGDEDLRVRCRDLQGTLSVPDDLIPLLTMTQAPDIPLRLEGLKNGEMLFDLDAVKINPVPKRMSQEEIVGQLDSLHKKANAFFRHKSVCTDHAFKVWKGDI